MPLTKVKGAVWDGLENGQTLSVKDFGAKGDNVTDDTSALQAAINYAASQILTIITNKVNTVTACVVLNSGTYKFSSITIPEGVTLIGDSRGSSVLSSTVTGSGIAVYLGSNSRECSSVALERVTLIGSGVAAGTYGVYAENCIRASFIRDCNISGFGYNISNKNSYGMHIYNNFVHDAVTNNMYLYGSTANVIEKNRFDDCPNGDNIIIDGQSSSECHGNLVIGNAIQRAKFSGVKCIDVEDITFVSNFFEGNDIAGGTASCANIVQGTRTVKSSRIGFFDNYTGLGSVAGAGHVCINITSAYRVEILGHKLKNGVGSHGNAVVLAATVDSLFGRGNDFFAATADLSATTSTVVDWVDVSGKSHFGDYATSVAQYDYVDSVSAGNLLNLNNTSGTAGSVTVQIKAGDTGTNTYQIYGLNSAGTNTFRVTGNGDTRNLNNVFGAISDERLKDIIGPASSTIDDFKAYEFVKYKLKGDENVQLGVIAQQVAEVSPGLVSLSPMYKDDDNGGREYIGDFYDVKYSVLYLKACVALQEVIKRVEELEKKANV